MTTQVNSTVLGTLGNLTVTGNITSTGSIIQNGVTGGIIPVGGIIMWSGNIASIPTSWALCNGSNGTPDLRNRFIVGAGSTYAVAATGGSADATLPSHTHTGSTSTNGDHAHSLYLAKDSFGSGDQLTGDDSPGTDEQTFFDKTGGTTNTTGNHSHSFTTNSTGESATNANLPPYYALAFIMRIS